MATKIHFWAKLTSYILNTFWKPFIRKVFLKKSLRPHLKFWNVELHDFYEI